MTRILALDPGSSHTGWALVDDESGMVLEHGRHPNETLLAWYRDALVNDEETLDRGDLVVLEFMSPRGMLTSEHEFDALWWAGRLTEALERTGLVRIERVSRQEVKFVLLGKHGVPKADAAVRAILIDRYASGGGKEAAIGVKAHPGPLYGIKADEWAALAVACAWRDDARDIIQERKERAEKKRAEAARRASRQAAKDAA